MKITSLNKEALKELKTNFLTHDLELEDLSYEEYCNIDELVPDRLIFRLYGNIDFTEDDFVAYIMD